MISTNTSRSRVAVAIAAGALAATSLAGYAAADQPETQNDAKPTIASTLTKAERQQMDDEVAENLRKSKGGKRISLNQIAWPKAGVVMTIPLPGEKRARPANQPIGTKGDGCSYKHACLYDYGDFEGKEWEFYYCGFQKLRDFNFTNKTSSWANNQKDYAKATLYYWTGSKVKKLDELWAPSYDEYLEGFKNNRADFIRAC